MILLSARSLLIAALCTCVGMTFLILACAVPNPKIFYPFFVLLFYFLSVLPVIISKRLSQGNEGTNPKSEFALFLTAGMVLSAFALPIVLAHCAVISRMACVLTLVSNVVNYLTMFWYAMKEDEFSSAYGGMF